MNENTDRINSSAATGNQQPGKAAVTLTVMGLLLVIAAFAILYRAERTNNRQWMLKQAEQIDPGNPGTDARTVKFTGVPSGAFIKDPDSGKRFVYLSRSLYEYRKGADASGTPEWHYREGDTRRAGNIRIGSVAVRLDEAAIIGGGAWNATLLVNRKGDLSSPRVGDLKAHISGIPSDSPLFCAGFLSGGFLGSGDLFIVSSLSEGATMEELRETFIWRWLRNPICFSLLVIGFLLLGHPAMGLMRRHSHLPVVKSLSRIGWPAYIVIALAASFFLVRFSPVTADLLWLIIGLIVGIPAVLVVRRIVTRRGGSAGVKN